MTACLSVCLSVCHTRDLCHNGGTDRDGFENGSYTPANSYIVLQRGSRLS